MRALLLSLIVLLQIVGPASQERQTPDGEWCQRPIPKMDKRAHPCACAKHDCSKDASDPNNLSAHTDPKCLNFCTVTKCYCQEMDCP